MIVEDVSSSAVVEDCWAGVEEEGVAEGVVELSSSVTGTEAGSRKKGGREKVGGGGGVGSMSDRGGRDTKGTPGGSRREGMSRERDEGGERGRRRERLSRWEGQVGKRKEEATHEMRMRTLFLVDSGRESRFGKEEGGGRRRSWLGGESVTLTFLSPLPLISISTQLPRGIPPFFFLSFSLRVSQFGRRQIPMKSLHRETRRDRVETASPSRSFSKRARVSDDD